MKKYSKKIVAFVLCVMMVASLSVPVFADGEISVYLDNQKIEFDVAPILINGRTMVPMRAIFENLGATVGWISESRTAIAKKDLLSVRITIDDAVLYKNGETVTLDVPAQLKNGRTLVPLRAVSEAFDCQVNWDGDTRTVNIFSKDTEIPSSIELSEAIIGVCKATPSDYYISGDFAETGAVIKRYENYETLFDALDKGEVDCVISEGQTADEMAENNDKFAVLGEEYAVEDYHICTSHKNKQLTEKINQAIQKLTDDGTLKQIISDGIRGKHTYVPQGGDYPNGVLVVATNATFPPFEYIDNGEITGIDIDVITAIADYLGYKVEIVDMEFDALIPSVAAGTVDVAIAGIVKTNERHMFCDFSIPYITYTQTIVINKDTYKAE